MQDKRTNPQRHSDLHDPKLPAVNAGQPGTRSRPTPIPPQPEL